MTACGSTASNAQISIFDGRLRQRLRHALPLPLQRPFNGMFSALCGAKNAKRNARFKRRATDFLQNAPPQFTQALGDTGMATGADVLKRIKDEDVKFVDLRFTDFRGKEQHVQVPEIGRAHV